MLKKMLHNVLVFAGLTAGSATLALAQTAPAYDPMTALAPAIETAQGTFTGLFTVSAGLLLIVLGAMFGWKTIKKLIKAI